MFCPPEWMGAVSVAVMKGERGRERERGTERDLNKRQPYNFLHFCVYTHQQQQLLAFFAAAAAACVVTYKCTAYPPRRIHYVKLYAKGMQNSMVAIKGPQGHTK